MSLLASYSKLSLTKKIYISTLIGFSVGMFFGEKCEALDSINTGFIKFFQTAIIPYMIFSIIKSIGALTHERAIRVGKKGGIILLVLWGISIFYAFGLQFSFPDIERSKFFRPQDAMDTSGLDIFDMFIPSNPFHSVANGYIPAIVIFCILIGIALISHKHKNGIVRSARIWASLMSIINDYIMKLLPLGVLVMSSYTFGTLDLVKFKGLLLYILASIFYLLFMSLVIYPGLLSSVSKIKYMEFFHFSMPAALVAFSTGSVFLALPVIYNQMYRLSDELKGFEGTCDNYVERGRNAMSIVIPLAWVVPASYKFLVIFFITFAYWYYDRNFSVSSQLVYFIGGIPCLFGSNSVVVPFLLQMGGDQLPANQAYDVFMIVASFLVYFNNANGAIFIITSTVLCYLSLSNKLKINWMKLIILSMASFVVFAVIVVGLSQLMTRLLAHDNQLKEELTHMNVEPYNESYYRKIAAEYLDIEQYKPRESVSPDESQLDLIVRTQTLQVGYDPEAMPFSFFNADGKLVGYDIDFIYDIAENLRVQNIEFYPIKNFNRFKESIDKGIKIDICVGGYVYMPMIDNKVVTSIPFMNYTPAIVIPVEDKTTYPDFMSVYFDKSVTLGVRGSVDLGVSSPGKERKMEVLESFSAFYRERKTQTLMTSAEIASAISIVYRGFWVYYYKGTDIKLFYAYLLPYGDKTASFRESVNVWIDVCRWNGVAKKRYEYWIMGQVDDKTSDAWSVLGWLKEHNYFLKSK